MQISYNHCLTSLRLFKNKHLKYFYLRGISFHKVYLSPCPNFVVTSCNGFEWYPSKICAAIWK